MAAQKFLGAVIILLLLGGYSHHQGTIEDQKHGSRIFKCVRSPSQCVGEPMVIRVSTNRWSGKLATAYVNLGNTYIVKQLITVTGIRGRRQEGRIMDLVGQFNERKIFVVTRQREMDWIQVSKYIVSLLGLGLCLLLFVTRYSFSASYRLPVVPRSMNR